MSPRSPSPDPPDALGLEQFQARLDDTGLPLDQLGPSYTELLTRGEDPYAPLPAEDTPDLASLASSSADEPVPAAEINPRSLLEAMLFVGGPQGESLTSKQVASLMRGVTSHEVDELVRELNELYLAEGCPYEIIGAEVGYRLVLRETWNEVRDRFFGRNREVRLTPAAIDILAIVAYQQPISRTEIEKLRGKPSGNVLNTLVRRQLLRFERDLQDPKNGRYFTTDRFLECLRLSSLDELPQSLDLDRK